MDLSAIQIAELLSGKIEGDPNITVNALCKIEEGKPKALSFLANPTYTPYLYDTKASVVIVNKDFNPEKKVAVTLIRVDDAHHAFAKILQIYDRTQKAKTGIHETANISTSAKLGKDAYVGAFVTIGNNAVIGENVKIYPNVFIDENVIIKDNTTILPGAKICSDSIIGKNCVLHMGCIIGSDGFGFAPNKENEYQKMAQIGNVVLEDWVDVGANTTIDRATLGSTLIKKGVKLDNLIQIAHNVEIGENTVIAAQAGIAGSTKIGKNCMIGGQVGIVGHLEIADGVKIAAQTGIPTSITKENEIVQGTPAMSIGEFKRAYVLFKRLPEMKTKINELEQELSKLKITVP